MPLRPLLASAAVAVLACGTVHAGAAPARPAYAPAATATVTPGVQLVTGSRQCTANFVFTDGTGAVYLGQSAHCAATSGSTQTNGCLGESLPLGTPVRVNGADKPGVLVYSSWVAMRAAAEEDADTCAANDFALVRLDPADVPRTNPSVPVFGGPVGLDHDGTRAGETVVSYGNSNLRFGVRSTNPKRGVSLGATRSGWQHTVLTATPGIPGDSGSGVLDGSGRAVGTLSSLAAIPGSNGVGDLSRQIEYARTHGMPGLTLEPGTEEFTGFL